MVPVPYRWRYRSGSSTSRRKVARRRRGPQAVRAPVMEHPRTTPTSSTTTRRWTSVPTVVPRRSISRRSRLRGRSASCSRPAVCPRGDRDAATTGGSRMPRHSAVLENRNGRPFFFYDDASEAPGSGLDALDERRRRCVSMMMRRLRPSGATKYTRRASSPTHSEPAFLLLVRAHGPAAPAADQTHPPRVQVRGEELVRLRGARRLRRRNPRA